MRDDQSVLNYPDKGGVSGAEDRRRSRTPGSTAGAHVPTTAGDGVTSTRAFPRVGSGASISGICRTATGSEATGTLGSADWQLHTLAQVSISS